MEFPLKDSTKPTAFQPRPQFLLVESTVTMYLMTFLEKRNKIEIVEGKEEKESISTLMLENKKELSPWKIRKACKLRSTLPFSPTLKVYQC